MPDLTPEQRHAREKGRRAEDVASWYFRLNGFLSIPGFVVHLDKSHAHIARDGSPRHARTEADLMGVRFVNSRERIFAGHDHRDMEDDVRLIQLAQGPDKQALFILVEVKAGLCKMNGPWTTSGAKNMQRVVRRLGFALDEKQVEKIASAMYERGRYQDDYYVLQYICVGANKNPEVNAVYPDVVQIDWSDIGEFLIRRFRSFPEKLPDGHVHDQWPDFGRYFGNWFTCQIRRQDDSLLRPEVIERYVMTGSFN